MNGTGEGPIRERDAAGVLQAAGYQWIEPRPGRKFWLLIFFVLPGFVGMLTGGISAISFLWAPIPFFARAMFIAIAVAVCAVSFGLMRFGQKKAGRMDRLRAVVFERSGLVRAPFGLPEYPSARSFGGAGMQVASVESRPEEDVVAHVDVYLSDGERVRVAESRHPDDAHKIAVQLTLALTELRAGARASRAASTTID
jgi:hypothetical protein